MSCSTSKNNYKLDLNNAKEVKSNILVINSLLKKIPIAPHYKNTFPQYDVKKKNIYITFSKINYIQNDSILEGRYNPNSQMIDTINHIQGLLDKEVFQLKKSINFLEREGIVGNEYFNNEFIERDENNNILSFCNFPFFVYPYKTKEWRTDNIDETKYIVVLFSKELKSDCFKKKYKVLDKVGNIYLITKNK